MWEVFFVELSRKEITLEEKRLEDTIDIVRSKISELGQELYDRDDKVLEFKKFMWDNRSDMDPTELKTMMVIGQRCKWILT